MKNCKSILFIVVFFVLIFKCFTNNVNVHASEINKQTNFCSIDEGYVYKVVDNTVNIVKINNYNNMTLENTIFEENMVIRNIYAYKNKLFIGGVKNYDQKSTLSILIYDISDKKNICKINEFSVAGEYHSFKVKDGIIFLLSDDGDKIGILTMDLNKSIIYPKTQEVNGENINFMYVSEDDIYIVCNDDSYDNKYTKIYKFDVNEDILTFVDEFSIEGTILNEKFINEYKHELRIVATNNEKNCLYVFDEDLKLLSFLDCNVENLNNIYFDNNIAYMCGYLKKGYIASFNLNPKALKELSRLELSTSINYLYKLDNNVILAIGNENRSDTYKNIQTDKVYEILKNVGIKMMLIDTKDKNNIKVCDDYLIKGKQVYSPSFVDENRLVYLKDRNMLIFPLDISNYNNDVDIYSAMEVSNMYDSFILNYEEVFNGIYIFDVSHKNGIELKFRIDNQKHYEMFDCKDIEYINVYREKIFIFSSDSCKIFNLKGEFLGEYSFGI